MTKNNVIFSIILLFVFISACYLSVSPVKTGVEVDDDQKNVDLTSLSTPKSSGYAITERWNNTSNKIVNVVAVSADGKYMVAVTDLDTGDEIFFYNTSDHDGDPMWSFDATFNIDSLAISADGKYVVAGSAGGQIALLFNSTVPDPGNNKQYVWQLIPNPQADVTSVDISADGKYIVAGVGNNVFLYNNSYPSAGINKFSEYEWVNDTDSEVRSVAISSDGKYVVAGILTGGFDSVFFWNTTEYDYNQEHAPMWSYDCGEDVNSVAISGKGEYVAAGTVTNGGGEELFLFNKSAVGQKQPEWSFEHSQQITSVAMSADGKYIAAGGGTIIPNGQGQVYLFNNSKPQQEWEYGTEGLVNSVDISADGKYTIVGTNYQQGSTVDKYNTIFLFNKSAEASKKPEWYFNASDDVNSVSMSAWGNYIAAGGTYAPGNGKAHLFYHARPIPPAFRPYIAGDDDDDDDEAEAIPFGNYYLVFAVIAIAALIMIYKRKTVLSKL